MATTGRPRRTLLCILDWGLGHATRSLALLNHELLAGDEVIVATSGPALALIRRGRPDLRVVELPGYRVRYPTGNMVFNVAVQLPKWLRVIRREHQITERVVGELRIDRIVSDNRFGCYAGSAPSIFLTHQLRPMTGFAPATALYRRWLQRFDAFWVPDSADRRLSGALSDPSGYREVRYIGPLSRFSRLPSAAKDVEVVALLSGPEPMRSRLEAMLLTEFAKLPGKQLLIRGTVSGPPIYPPETTRVIDYADAATLAELLPTATYLLSRAGYSTLMDIDAMGLDARMIFVPTPGQTEQEYLALTRVQGLGAGRGAVLTQSEIAGGGLVAYLQGRQHPVRSDSP